MQDTLSRLVDTVRAMENNPPRSNGCGVCVVQAVVLSRLGRVEDVCDEINRRATAVLDAWKVTATAAVRNMKTSVKGWLRDTEEQCVRRVHNVLSSRHGRRIDALESAPIRTPTDVVARIQAIELQLGTPPSGHQPIHTCMEILQQDVRLNRRECLALENRVDAMDSSATA